MDSWKKRWSAVKNNRKFRCGGFSVALTAAAVACALLLGALCDRLENRYALQVDCSFNGATTQGEITRAALAQLEKDVTIFAVVPADGGDETLLSLLNRYDAASSRVTVRQESLLQNPVLQSRYTDAAGKNAVTDDCLIVTCPETGLTRVLTGQDYLVQAYNLETGYFDEISYSYEKSVTEAILFVTQDRVPTIQILSGHGEKTADETELMESTLVSANYQVKRVNLAAGDALDPESPLMLLSPRYDLTERELSQLTAFAGAGGNFFVCSQYSDPLTLENYNAFLRSYGVEPYPGIVLAKAGDTDSYYADSPVILMPEMQETDVTRSLLAAGEDVLFMAAARAFRSPRLLPEGVMLSPVLMTGEAYIRNIDDGSWASDQQPGDEEGRFPVALWAEKMAEDGTLSRMFVIGDMTMFLDYWMLPNTSATAFLLQIMRTLQGQAPINLAIVPKTAQRQGLSLGNITPAVIVTVLLPLLVLLGALLTLVPRRNL